MRKFFTDKGGNVALIFALALLPIAILVGGSVDLSRMRVERTKLQAAVDAAVLAAARMPINSTDAQIDAAINNFVAANYDGEGTITQVLISRSSSGGVDVDAVSNVPMTFSALLGRDVSPVTASSAAERGGVNLEISLVLDVTGSMEDDLGSLQTAATSLINSVVQDVQTPYYSKAAIVPYSTGVYLGGMADDARGAPVPAKEISDYSSEMTGGFDITSASQERPTEIRTHDNHGLQDGNYIRIYDVQGMTELNGETYRVDRRGAKKIDLYDYWNNKIDSRWWDEYEGGGVLYRCYDWWCSNLDAEKSFVSENHGFSDGEKVYVSDVGLPYFQDKFYTVDRVSDDRLNFDGANTYGTYSSGGKIDCTYYGCPYYRFWDPDFGRFDDSDERTWDLTDCVSERTGDEAYTDASPSSAPVGMIYDNDGGDGDCPNRALVPLTSNKTTLTTTITNLSTGGGTAGHIGIAWGWYTLSPNFNEMWPTSTNNAAAYGTPQVLKVAVIMTDGEFNRAYCNGVPSQDYGGQINCDATNGDPFDQAEALCDAMKAAGITIYTVGFRLAADSEEEAIMEYCASGSALLASNGTALQTAFASIGESIGQLRLTR